MHAWFTPIILSFLLFSTLTPSSIFASTPEVIYDNTTTAMMDTTLSPARQRYANALVEYGDELQLAGSARLITDIYFEYFGNFASSVGKSARVRIYNNTTPWDSFRNSPTDTLFESDFFQVYSGYHVQHLQNLSISVPDTITLGLSFSGLGPNEDAGFLMYSPPTVGASFNEFWRRIPGGWEAFRYSTVDPTYKANASIRILAVVESIQLHVQLVNNQLQLTWTGPGANFEVQRAATIDGNFEAIGTTSQKSWTETILQGGFYRVKQL